MEEADMLCDELFPWLDNRKKCAGKLLELAQKLEDVPQGSNIAQVFTASISAVAAALISVLTGQASSILLATANIVDSPTSTATEAGVSSSTFKQATELIQEYDEAGRNIQKLLRDLKDRCGETLKDRCAGALLGTHADELDCEVTTLLMWALARRRNTHVPLDFLRGFNRAMFFRHMTPGGLDPAEASDFIRKALGLDRSPEITRSLTVSTKVMMKNIELIGIKAADAGSEGAIGLGISLYDLIVTSEELVKGNRFTEASEFLRDSAREILDGQQKLKAQLDAMHKIIQKLLQMKNLIENLGEYSDSMNENAQKIMEYIIGTCTDSTVVSWLQVLPHQIEFVNLLRFFLKRKSPIPEDLKKPHIHDHIDIVFVAHGCIDDQFMPAGVLVPTPNITDTILYSPWNCRIDANTAFAIAQGTINPADRKFHHMAHCEPDPLPDRWNRMRESHHDIPVILLSPLTPEDRAWHFFHQLWQNNGIEIGDRVIIPYLVPKDMVNAFREIPLYMFIFATSFSLMLSNKTATVHLAACLSRKVSHLLVKWRRQYAYTKDAMYMTVDLDNRNMDSELFTALSSLFDRNRR